MTVVRRSIVSNSYYSSIKNDNRSSQQQYHHNLKKINASNGSFMNSSLSSSPPSPSSFPISHKPNTTVMSTTSTNPSNSTMSMSLTTNPSSNSSLSMIPTLKKPSSSSTLPSSLHPHHQQQQHPHPHHHNHNNNMYHTPPKQNKNLILHKKDTPPEPDYEARRRYCLILFICLNGLSMLCNLNFLIIHHSKKNSSSFAAAATVTCETKPEMTANSITNALKQTNDLPPHQQVGYNEFHSNIEFVFTIGLEGTGHHLLKDVLQYAPNVNTINKPFRYYDIGRVALAMFSPQDTHEGLLSAHCDYNSLTHEIQTTPVNENELLQKWVSALQNVNDKILQNTNNNTSFPITVPLNGMPETHERFGMLSFPAYAGKCRDLLYLNLDIFYQACHLAKVDCGHLYLHRNSYSIIQSTVYKRQFSYHTLTAVQLYVAQLSVLYTQLQMHSTKTIACIDFFQAQTTSIQQEMEAIHDLFGWKTTTTTTTTDKSSSSNYTNMLQDVYHASRHVAASSETELLKSIPAEFHVYVKSMEKLNKAIMGLCQQQAQQNNYI